MRVMIFADMEGVAGIQSWEYTGGEGERYEEGRRLYTAEIAAAVRGCKKAGATEIWAVDGHGGSSRRGRPFMNWINEYLEPGARYVQGYPWARYVAPFESGIDCVAFVGAHAMAGVAEGVLSHTVSSETWYNADINGTLVGESGIVAAIAGCWDVPAVFVSGDTATCEEVRALVGEKVVTAPVKEGLSRYAACNLCPVDACRLIEEQIMHALYHREDWPAPLRFEPPVTFTVELATPDRAAAFQGRRGVEIVGPRTVRAVGGSFWEAWDAFWYRT
jgi:D-amino peptidase